MEPMHVNPLLSTAPPRRNHNAIHIRKLKIHRLLRSRLVTPIIMKRRRRLMLIRPDCALPADNGALPLQHGIISLIIVRFFTSGVMKQPTTGRNQYLNGAEAASMCNRTSHCLERAQRIPLDRMKQLRVQNSSLSLRAVATSREKKIPQSALDRHAG